MESGFVTRYIKSGELRHKAQLRRPPGTVKKRVANPLSIF